MRLISSRALTSRAGSILYILLGIILAQFITILFKTYQYSFLQWEKDLLRQWTLEPRIHSLDQAQLQPNPAQQHEEASPSWRSKSANAGGDGLVEAFHSSHHNSLARQDGPTLANELSRRVRVLCWVLTDNSRHQHCALHVKATWLPNCNGYVFFSSEEDPSFPAVKLNISEKEVEEEGWEWARTKAALEYLIRRPDRDDYDWFLRADDETYVVMENLRLFLLAYNPQEPVYFGLKLRHPLIPQGYMHGYTGYVLSRHALERLETEGTNQEGFCEDEFWAVKSKKAGNESEKVEDVWFGACLERLGVRAGDSRDAAGRHRFLPYTPHYHLERKTQPERDEQSIADPGAGEGDWLRELSYYPLEQGADYCSDFAISFHHVHRRQLYVLHYFIYHLRPYGLEHPIDTKHSGVGGQLWQAYSEAVMSMGRDNAFRKWVNISELALPLYLFMPVQSRN